MKQEVQDLDRAISRYLVEKHELALQGARWSLGIMSGLQPETAAGAAASCMHVCVHAAASKESQMQMPSGGET
jgi:hypothetical protein